MASLAYWTLLIAYQGVFDGVTGIVRQPVKGAMEEGVSGFFKGDMSICCVGFSIFFCCVCIFACPCDDGPFVDIS